MTTTANNKLAGTWKELLHAYRQDAVALKKELIVLRQRNTLPKNETKRSGQARRKSASLQKIANDMADRSTKENENQPSAHLKISDMNKVI